MIIYEFCPEKNEWLKNNRKISFDDIIIILKSKKEVDIINNLNEKYNHQKSYIIKLNEYIYVVPFVINENKVFLKTIYPSRSHTKQYLKKEYKNEKSNGTKD